MSIDLTSTAVLGLGPMGYTVASVLLAHRIPVTVWNRTPARTEPLAEDGARTAATPPEAFADADLVVVCLRDHHAFRDVFATLDQASLRGRVVVNVATATPEEARETAEWAADRGMSYLSGAIMVPTPMIGDPEALILYAGDEEHFAGVAARLRVLAGRAEYLGTDHGLPSVLDLAMLTIFFAGMTAYLQAVAMVTAQGGDAAWFQRYAEQIVAVLAAELPVLAKGVDAADYAGAADNLSMELRALEHVVAANRELDLDLRLPLALREVVSSAVAAGHGGESFTRVVEVLRRGTGATAVDRARAAPEVPNPPPTLGVRA